MATELFRMTILACVFAHGVRIFHHEMHQLPKLSANERFLARVRWKIALVVWVMVQASPAIYYGSELLETVHNTWAI